MLLCDQACAIIYILRRVTALSGATAVSSPSEARDEAKRGMECWVRDRELNTENVGMSASLKLGRFTVQLDQGALKLWCDDRQGAPMWRCPYELPLVRAAHGEATVSESRGFFQIKDQRAPYLDSGPIDQLERQGDRALLSGPIGAEARWTLELFEIDEVQLGFRLSSDDPTLNRLQLLGAVSPTQRVFGFGEQFTALNMKGRVVPILSQEPGIGRGIQPLTWLLNLGFKAGGAWHNTNAPAPWFLTSDLLAMCLESYEHSVFDFSTPDQVKISVFATELRGRLFVGDSPASLLEAYTRFTGRMRPLPEWIQRGAVIGMQGGTEAVKRTRERLEASRAPIAAFWLQDWVGARRTSIGWQLWWNWELDHERYPGWRALVESLKASGIRVMTYLNPFLVDPQEKGSYRRNLYQEALERGYLIKRNGAPYLILNTSFSAAMLDLSNPDARAWVKEVIKDELIATGASGWMADFGEALPFDAELYQGRDAAVFHNEYPEAWAQVNREAIQEAGLDDEVVFFMRSGYSRSPQHNTLFWMGDQLTSWSREDGIKSTLIALLSSGLSGFSLNHSDIGGYTATTMPRLPLKLPGVSFTRSRALLHRWIELNAFTSVYRTHEGNQPDRHYQIDGDEETLAHFARFARVYAALAPYRIELGREASERGLPVVRHPWLHYPDDPQALTLELQFMLGPDVMVAPVLDQDRSRVSLYLPAGSWSHLWTGETCERSEGQWYSVAAPPGAPAVFCRAGSEVYKELKARLEESGDLQVTVPELLQEGRAPL